MSASAPPQKESGEKFRGSRSRQLSASGPSKRIQHKIMGLQIPPTFCIKRIQPKIMGLQIPRTFCIRSLKKNQAENYGAPDPANLLHQLPQKESSIKLWGSRSRQLSASGTSKRIQHKILGLQIPPTFCIKRIQPKIMGLQIPPTFCIRYLKKNPA